MLTFDLRNRHFKGVAKTSFSGTWSGARGRRLVLSHETRLDKSAAFNLQNVLILVLYALF